MDLEYTVSPFLDWFRGAFFHFVRVSVILALGGLIVGYLLAAVRLGPGPAAYRIMRTLIDATRDFRQVSFRRLGAIAKLTVRESMQRYVVVVFVIFLVILLFAAWYLDPESDNPARLYLSTVINSTNVLLFVLALFLSAFSIPQDIRTRTIYTVVTKPVRPWEIVLGRVAGFTAVCTVILALIGASSYIFVQRGLAHGHTVNELEVETIGRGPDAISRVPTSRNMRHRHEVTLNAEGIGETDSRLGHIHYAERGEDGEIRLGEPEYHARQARKAVYADSIEFRDREGNPTERGISVGREYRYRGYLEGQTDCAAIWRFSNLDARDFPEGIPLEMTLRVFRTHTGDIEKGIAGSFSLFNPLFTSGEPVDSSQLTPETAVRSQAIQIVASEYSTDSLFINRRMVVQMPDNTTREADIFDALVHDGQLDIRLQCDAAEQYYGVALPDLYIRAADNWFGWNFAKTYYSIWLQLLIVISLGVMMSTFLSGAVAMLGTLFCVAIGFSSQLIWDVALGKLEGGGAVESLVRLVSQKNQVSPLEEGVATTVTQWVDFVINHLMAAAASVMPNFRGFPEFGGMNTVGFTASGFDIPLNLIAQHSLAAFAYVIVVACFAYCFLKTREIAA